MSSTHQRTRGQTWAAGLAALAMCTASLAADAVLTPPKNRYTPDEDVALGRRAATATERQMPILKDDAVTSYVQDVGGRLVGTIPPELQHPEFHYTFKVVDAKDINAFALPGGPMYVHRGIIEAAHTEGELAGVMAHEMSHVALRHGTAQATKAERFSIGQLAGILAGAAVGGDVGYAIAQGSQIGTGAVFLRYSRDYERQADLLGIRLMARAGYDPRELAHMFQTIEHQDRNAPPQWLSDHPNPGNRVQYINDEATRVIVEPAPASSADAFAQTQAHLKTLPPAQTLAEIARARNARPRR